jgi:hypothetical protein
LYFLTQKSVSASKTGSGSSFGKILHLKILNFLQNLKFSPTMLNSLKLLKIRILRNLALEDKNEESYKIKNFEIQYFTKQIYGTFKS